MIADNKTPRSFATHDGSFHADEITACALLLHFGLIDPEKVLRTRESALIEKSDYVCDVGGVYDPDRHLFDHHQIDYDGYLSSAGQVLQYLLDQGVIDLELYHFLNNSLIIGVDAHDNGRELHSLGVCTYSHIINLYNPIQQDALPASQDKAFFEALSFSLGLIQRMIARFSYIRECRALVATAMRQCDTCLIFDQSIPWLENFFALGGESHSALYVLMPSGNQWKLRGIPPSLDKRMEVRKPFPIDWAGLLKDELTSLTGIEGAIFCHKGRFISVWETREAALEALKQCLKLQ